MNTSTKTNKKYSQSNINSGSENDIIIERNYKFTSYCA